MMTPESSLYLNYGNDYGLTMRLKQYKNILLAGHDGQSPPYFTSIWTVPAKGLAVTLALNTEGGDILSTNLIPELILDDLCELPEQGDLWQEGPYCPERESLQTGTYLGDALGLFRLEMHGGRPCLTDREGTYPLRAHVRRGVYFYEKNGRRICVGMPAVNGGSAGHLMLQSLLCRKVCVEPLPEEADVSEYEGEYGTVLERYVVRRAGIGLEIWKNGSCSACTHVSGDIFACDFGAVTFVRMQGAIAGVRVGSSTTHNKR